MFNCLLVDFSKQQEEDHFYRQHQSQEEDKQLQQQQRDQHHHKQPQSFTRRIFLITDGHRSKQTCEKYRNCFEHFLDYIRIHDLDVLLDLGKEAIQDLVIKYVLSMRDNPDKRYTRSTVNTSVAAILYFLDNNDIELNRHKISRYYPTDELSSSVSYDYNNYYDRPYTTEEIQHIISIGCSDLRSKAIILLLASSGIRIGALTSIQIGDITETTYDDNKENLNSTIYKVEIYARTRDRYYTFCTPECYKAISDYLKYRQRCGEELKSKSPLFRTYFNRQDPFAINVPKFMARQTFALMIDEALKKSGVKTKEAMRSHAFRKGFKSICERKGMKSLHVEMLMGHDTGLAASYYRPSEFDLLDDYMTHAADSLTIDPTFRLQKQVTKLETERTEEIDRLKAELTKLSIENQQAATTIYEHNTKLYERNNDIAELKAAVAFLADKVNAAIIANEPSSKVILNKQGVATGIRVPVLNYNTATAPLAKITEENQESASL